MSSRASKEHGGVDLPQPVLDRLAGKRFTLIDFEALELEAILKMLDKIGAFSRVMDNAQIRKNPSVLDSFDICVCALSQLPSDDELCTPCDNHGKPELLVGTLDEILRQSLKHQ